MSDGAARGRWAVAAMFAVNGFLIGSWAPQVPLLVTRLAITETTLGLLILVFGLGAVTAMPVCGLVMARLGSRRVLRVLAVLSTFGLLLVALAPDPWLAAPALFFFGAVIGGTDVSMNTNAVAAERMLGRAIMSSSHGFWSLGGFFGGALGGFAVLHLGHMTHALLVTLASLAAVLAASGSLVADERPAARRTARASFPTNPLIYLIGLMALLSMLPEGAVLEWAALHLQQAFGSDIATASLAFATFSGAMAAMRFLGDGIRNRFGAVTTMRASSLIAASALFVAGSAGSDVVAIAAFAVCGLGIANMVPIAFSAAGNQPGMASGTGMSVATTMGYSGILLAPSAIGFVGERIGFAPVFLALAGLLLVVFAMAGFARNADFAIAQPAE